MATKKTQTKKNKLPKLETCPCKIGSVSSDCPFSYSNYHHNMRAGVLLQTSPKILRAVANMTDEARSKLASKEMEYNSEYFFNENLELLKRNNGKLTPKDYYFQLVDDEDMGQPVLWLTTRAFFDADGCLDDQERDEYDCLPPGYPNNMEACFDIPNDDIPAARKQLLAMGFVEKKMV